MPCNCIERNQRDAYHSHDPLTKRPNSPCLYCAEKHIATAAAWAREEGYAGVNRGYVVGELRAACAHLAAISEAATLSDHLRDFRHRIQSRTEDETATDFTPYLLAIDVLIRQQEQPSRKESAL